MMGAYVFKTNSFLMIVFVYVDMKYYIDFPG